MAEAQARDFSSYVGMNMLTNIVRTVLAALLGLFLVPFYISELGGAVYAILPLATSVTTYVLVISDEITNAFSRYLVISLHEDGGEGASRVYTTAVIGLAKTILAVAPIVVLVSIVSPYVFQIGPSSAFSVQMMFLMILSSALAISFSACFNSIYIAFNKMYVLYTIRIAYLLIQVAMVIGFFVMFGPSLELIGLAYVISGAIFFVLVKISSKRLCQTLRFDRSLYSRDLLKEMRGVGAWTVLNKLALLMFIQTSLIIVNLFIGAEEETEFAIVATLISMTNTACITITTVIAPLQYRNYATDDRDKLMRISKTAMRFIGLVTAFPIAFLCIFSPQILTVWVGESFSHLSEIIIIMFSVQLAVCVISVLEVLPVLYLGIRKVAWVTLLAGALNIIAAVAVLKFTDMGMAGVAVVWTVVMLALNVLYYPLVIAKMTSSGWTTFLRPMVPGHVALIICLVAGWAATRFFTLPSAWTAVLVLFFAGYAAYTVAAFALGLSREDKDAVRGTLPGPIAKIIPRWML
jgi:membrane protein EpsK